LVSLTSFVAGFCPRHLNRSTLSGENNRMTLLNSKIKLLAFALTFALLFLCSNEVSFAQKKTPRFKDYSVTEIYKGKNAPIKLTRDDKMFRTRLKWAVDNQKPNFAGQYILTTWGCGAQCIMGAVIDAKTGKVSWWNFSICCYVGETDENFQPIEFRNNSKLIIFFGYRNEGDGDNSAHYYKFENGRFVHLQSVLSEEQL